MQNALANSTATHDKLPADGDKLAAGTWLRRLYKGRPLEVKVLAQGFEYEGRIYASLSALAKTITGSHCSGRRFFGLQQREAVRGGQS